MRKCIVHPVTREDGSEGWSCGKYLMSSGVAFRMTAEKCYHYKCPGRQHLSMPDDSATESLPLKVCAWHTCNNELKNPKSKYCSTKCRSRNSSRTYREKKRAKNVPSRDEP